MPPDARLPAGGWGTRPASPVIRQLVEAGEIGTLLEMRSRGKEDHRGGALDAWVLGSHTFNLAAWFAGPPVACSGMLYPDGRPCTREHVRAGDEGVGPIAGNEVHARFKMGDGTPFHFDSIQHRGDQAAAFGLQLIGTAGVIDFRIDREPLAHIRRGNPQNRGNDVRPFRIPSPGRSPRRPVAPDARPSAVADVIGRRLRCPSCTSPDSPMAGRARCPDGRSPGPPIRRHDGV